MLKTLCWQGKVGFIPFPSLINSDGVDAHKNGIVLEQSGKRYLLATVSEGN